jgi:hypothetical protein
MGSALLWASGRTAAEDDTAGAIGDTAVEQGQEDLVVALPEPAVRRVDLPVLTPEQRARYDEVQRYLARRYRDYRIVETTQTYLGDIVDWLDPATVPGSEAEPPPRPSLEELRPPPGAELQTTELDRYPELSGPKGTIPVIRPRFAGYVRGETKATSVEDFIQNRQVPGQPAGRNRLYAGLLASSANKNVVSWINDFGEIIEPGTLSLIEMATVCEGSNPDTTMELVGAATSRDWANFGDWVLRIQVEFLTAGMQIGDGIGGWDGIRAGFVAAAGRPYGPGIALMPVSMVGGTQYTSRFQILLSGGKWWVSHNGNWLGYYLSSHFDLIPSSGCRAQWYGEVFDPTPTDWTWTNMGSGLFSSGGFGSAAYVMTPYYTAPSGINYWPDGALNAGPVDAACYTKSSLLTGGPGQERYFFLGGPGGDAVGCN